MPSLREGADDMCHDPQLSALGCLPIQYPGVALCGLVGVALGSSHAIRSGRCQQTARLGCCHYLEKLFHRGHGRLGAVMLILLDACAEEDS